MNARAASWLAWSLCTLVVALGTATIALQALNGRGTVQDTIAAGGALTSAVVGAVVASRRPGNPVGWFFLGSSISLTLAELTSEYALYGLRTVPRTLPFARVMAWPQTWLWVPGVALSLIFLPLYFPNGRLPSRRWRWVVWISAAFCAYSAVVAAFLIDTADDEAGIANPFLIPADGPVVEVLEGVMQWLLVPVVVASAASLVVRFRRSRGEERQQMKWLTYVAALMPVLILLASRFQVADYAAGILFASVPVVVGIAVLKYRLYDVDLLINRTLVYATLTAALLSVYVGGVVTLQLVFRGLMGQGNQLAVVASTLAIAALFQPLRRRIQELIDHRFYRQKYDARKTLAAFGATLRDEVDLGRLGGELVSVTLETLQPAHVSVWLRDPDARGRTGVEGR